MSDEGRDFKADFKAHVDEFFIYEYEKKMPLRLVDTYTGLILKRSDITLLLRKRSEFVKKLDAAASEASRLPTSERPPVDPDFNTLDNFIKEYLAFATFSHRWRGREVTIKDLRNPIYAGGIYSIAKPPDGLSKQQGKDFMVGAKKLQEFCCAAAKCGYRWAWADTCCIDDEVFGEKSESLNSMFLWYRTSDLTIVFLDDVEDVKEGRLPAVEGDRWLDDENIYNPFTSSYPSSPEAPAVAVTLYQCYRRNPLWLQSMQPDTQVESAVLWDHLDANFPSVPDWEAHGKYIKIPEWVTRGWTLQETLASRRLRFYSRRWTLLEEADDRDTEEDEAKIIIRSFKYRARLVDHRQSAIWSEALTKTTAIPVQDLVKFEPGTRDVRSRLRWAARRRTTKDEDMTYCLLGIFDITLPAFYGEGHRAFFRLQEEIMKRTGDISLFDWRGRNSPVNSFLAYSPTCFTEPNLPDPEFPDSNDSLFHMILNLIRLIWGTAWNGIKKIAGEIMDSIQDVVMSSQLGHALVNGGLNVSLLEHQVTRCEPLEDSTQSGAYHHYRLEVDGLAPTTVTFASHATSLMQDPTQYYLCRAWNQETHNAFGILLDMVKYILYDITEELWKDVEEESPDKESELKSASLANGEEDSPESRLRTEMQVKRKEVMKFFKGGFPVFLIHVKDRRRVRVNTVKRVVGEYAMFDFSMPVVNRIVL